MHHETISGSSTINSSGYDPATKRMQIKFASGVTYEYEDVDAPKYAAFQAAAKDDSVSTGWWFHSQFKGKHKYQKL